MKIKEKYLIIDNAVTDKSILDIIKNDKTFFPEPKKLETGDVNRVDGSERTPIEYIFWEGWISNPILDSSKKILIKHLCEKILPLNLDGVHLSADDIYGFEHWARTFLPGQFSFWHFDKGFGKGVDKTLNSIFVLISSDDAVKIDKGIYELGRFFSVKYILENNGQNFYLTNDEIFNNFSFKDKKFEINKNKIKNFFLGFTEGLKECANYFGFDTKNAILEFYELHNKLDEEELLKHFNEHVLQKENHQNIFINASAYKNIKCAMGMIYYPSILDDQDQTFLQMYIDDDIIEVECKPNRLLIFNSSKIYHQSTPPKNKIRYSFPINIWSKENKPNLIDHYFFNYEV